MNPVSAPIHISLAGEGDLPALRSLFQRVFQEKESGLSLFFSRVYQPQNTVTAHLDGRLAGMFYLLPARLRCRDAVLPIAYLYALAVEPDLRGRGIAGAILRYLDGLLPDRGFQAAVLRPAEESLFAYYARFGYDSLFYARRWSFQAFPPRTPFSVRPISLERLPRPRDSFFPASSPLFSWEDIMLRYASDYAGVWGGKTLWIECAGHSGYALCYPAGKRLMVSEFAGDDLPSLATALCAATGTEGGEAILPPEAGYGERFPYGALKWYSPPLDLQNGYLSLTLD